MNSNNRFIDVFSTNKKLIIANIIRIFLLISIFVEFNNQRWPIVFVNLLGFILSFLPWVIDKIFSITLLKEFELLFLSYLVFTVFLEKILIGVALQIYLGISLGIVGFVVMFVLYSNSRIRMSYYLVAGFSFCFSVALGAVWEIFRYFLIYFFELNLADNNINYTAWGLIFTAIGATISSMSGLLYIKFSKGNFLQKIADAFVIRNPDLLVGYESTPHYIDNLIKKGECETVEFKSTLRTNLHTNNSDKRIEQGIMKTITAFLNSEGGTLLVGVGDDGNVMGIQKDGFQNHDWFYRHFTNLVKKHIGNEYIPYIKSEIIPYEDVNIFKVDCLKSYKEVFMKTDNNEEFYVRNGPSSVKLNGSKLIDYVDQRFKKEK